MMLYQKDMSLRDIRSVSREGRDAILEAIKELKEAGYVSIKRIDRKVTYTLNISHPVAVGIFPTESKSNDPETVGGVKVVDGMILPDSQGVSTENDPLLPDFQGVSGKNEVTLPDSQGVGALLPESQGVGNKEKVSPTPPSKRKKEKTTTSSSPKERKRFTKPKAETVAEYMTSRGWANAASQAQGFIDFYDSKGWMIGKNHMKDWKAAVRTWERKEGRAVTAVPDKHKKIYDIDYSALTETTVVRGAIYCIKHGLNPPRGLTKRFFNNLKMKEQLEKECKKQGLNPQMLPSK